MLNPAIISELEAEYDKLVEAYCQIATRYCYDKVLPFVEKYHLTVTYSIVEQDWGFFDPQSSVTLRSWMTSPHYVPVMVSQELTNDFVNVILPIMLVPFPGRDRLLMGSLMISTLVTDHATRTIVDE